MGPQRQTCFLPVSLWRLYEQAFLRRHTFQTGFPSRRSSREKGRSCARPSPSTKSRDKDVRQWCRFESQSSVDGFRLARHVIHQQILAKRVWGCEVRLASTDLRDFLHELNQPKVRSKHERVNHHSAAFAT